MKSDLATLAIDALEELLWTSRRIAVLGIQPESRRDRAAGYIPEYLASVGYDIVPVTVAHPELSSILGHPIHRTVASISGRVDIVSVFRRPEHIPPHVADLLEARPRAVWFQSGTLHVPSAQRLAAHGIAIAHDCIACRRASMKPSTSPLWEASDSSR